MICSYSPSVYEEANDELSLLRDFYSEEHGLSFDSIEDFLWAIATGRLKDYGLYFTDSSSQDAPSLVDSALSAIGVRLHEGSEQVNPVVLSDNPENRELFFKIIGFAKSEGENVFPVYRDGVIDIRRLEFDIDESVDVGLPSSYILRNREEAEYYYNRNNRIIKTITSLALMRRVLRAVYGEEALDSDVYARYEDLAADLLYGDVTEESYREYMQAYDDLLSAYPSVSREDVISGVLSKTENLGKEYKELSEGSFTRYTKAGELLSFLYTNGTFITNEAIRDVYGDTLQDKLEEDDDVSDAEFDGIDVLQDVPNSLKLLLGLTVIPPHRIFFNYRRTLSLLVSMALRTGGLSEVKRVLKLTGGTEYEYRVLSLIESVEGGAFIDALSSKVKTLVPVTSVFTGEEKIVTTDGLYTETFYPVKTSAKNIGVGENNTALYLKQLNDLFVALDEVLGEVDIDPESYTAEDLYNAVATNNDLSLWGPLMDIMRSLYREEYGEDIPDYWIGLYMTTNGYEIVSSLLQARALLMSSNLGPRLRRATTDKARYIGNIDDAYAVNAFRSLLHNIRLAFKNESNYMTAYGVNKSGPRFENKSSLYVDIERINDILEETYNKAIEEGEQEAEAYLRESLHEEFGVPFIPRIIYHLYKERLFLKIYGLRSFRSLEHMFVTDEVRALFDILVVLNIGTAPLASQVSKNTIPMIGVTRARRSSLFKELTAGRRFSYGKHVETSLRPVSGLTALPPTGILEVTGRSVGLMRDDSLIPAAANPNIGSALRHGEAMSEVFRQEVYWLNSLINRLRLLKENGETTIPLILYKMLPEGASLNDIDHIIDNFQFRYLTDLQFVSERNSENIGWLKDAVAGVLREIARRDIDYTDHEKSLSQQKEIVRFNINHALSQLEDGVYDIDSFEDMLIEKMKEYVENGGDKKGLRAIAAASVFSYYYRMRLASVKTFGLLSEYADGLSGVGIEVHRTEDYDGKVLVAFAPAIKYKDVSISRKNKEFNNVMRLFLSRSPVHQYRMIELLGGDADAGHVVELFEGAFVGRSDVESKIRLFFEVGVMSYMMRDDALLKLQFLYGGLYNTGKLSSDMFKRIVSQQSPGVIPYLSNTMKVLIEKDTSIDPSLGKYLLDITEFGMFNFVTAETLETTMSAEAKDELTRYVLERVGGSDVEVDEADAAGVIPLPAYRAIRIMLRTWDDRLERIYRAMMSGNKEEYERLALQSVIEGKPVFDVLKLQYEGPTRGISHIDESGFIEHNSSFVRENHKFALLPIHPSIDSYEGIGEIYNNLLEGRVHYLLVTSASKKNRYIHVKAEEDGKIRHVPYRLFKKDKGKKSVEPDKVGLFDTSSGYVNRLKLNSASSPKIKDSVKINVKLLVFVGATFNYILEDKEYVDALKKAGVTDEEIESLKNYTGALINNLELKYKRLVDSAKEYMEENYGFSIDAVDRQVLRDLLHKTIVAFTDSNEAADAMMSLIDNKVLLKSNTVLRDAVFKVMKRVDDVSRRVDGTMMVAVPEVLFSPETSGDYYELTKTGEITQPYRRDKGKYILPASELKELQGKEYIKDGAFVYKIEDVKVGHNQIIVRIGGGESVYSAEEFKSAVGDEVFGKLVDKGTVVLEETLDIPGGYSFGNVRLFKVTDGDYLHTISVSNDNKGNTVLSKHTVLASKEVLTSFEGFGKVIRESMGLESIIPVSKEGAPFIKSRLAEYYETMGFEDPLEAAEDGYKSMLGRGGFVVLPDDNGRVVVLYHLVGSSKIDTVDNKITKAVLFYAYMKKYDRKNLLVAGKPAGEVISDLLSAGDGLRYEKRFKELSVAVDNEINRRLSEDINADVSDLQSIADIMLRIKRNLEDGFVNLDDVLSLYRLVKKAGLEEEGVDMEALRVSLMELLAVNLERVNAPPVSTYVFEEAGELKEAQKGLPVVAPKPVVISFHKHYLPLLFMKHKDGRAIGSVDRLNEMLQDPDFGREVVDKYTSLDFRVPLQSSSSLEVQYPGRFLSPTISSVITTNAFVVFSRGSDHDFDKNNVLIPRHGLEIIMPEGEVIMEDEYELIQKARSFKGLLSVLREGNMSKLSTLIDRAKSVSIVPSEIETEKQNADFIKASVSVMRLPQALLAKAYPIAIEAMSEGLDLLAAGRETGDRVPLTSVIKALENATSVSQTLNGIGIMVFLQNLQTVFGYSKYTFDLFNKVYGKEYVFDFNSGAMSILLDEFISGTVDVEKDDRLKFISGLIEMNLFHAFILELARKDQEMNGFYPIRDVRSKENARRVFTETITEFKDYMEVLESLSGSAALVAKDASDKVRQMYIKASGSVTKAAAYSFADYIEGLGDPKRKKSLNWAFHNSYGVYPSKYVPAFLSAITKLKSANLYFVKTEDTGWVKMDNRSMLAAFLNDPAGGLTAVFMSWFVHHMIVNNVKLTDAGLKKAEEDVRAAIDSAISTGLASVMNIDMEGLLSPVIASLSPFKKLQAVREVREMMGHALFTLHYNVGREMSNAVTKVSDFRTKKGAAAYEGLGRYEPDYGMWFDAYLTAYVSPNKSIQGAFYHLFYGDTSDMGNKPLLSLLAGMPYEDEKAEEFHDAVRSLYEEWLSGVSEDVRKAIEKLLYIKTDNPDVTIRSVRYLHPKYSATNIASVEETETVRSFIKEALSTKGNDTEKKLAMFLLSQAVVSADEMEQWIHLLGSSMVEALAIARAVSERFEEPLSFGDVSVERVYRNVVAVEGLRVADTFMDIVTDVVSTYPSAVSKNIDTVASLVVSEIQSRGGVVVLDKTHELFKNRRTNIGKVAHKVLEMLRQIKETDEMETGIEEVEIESEVIHDDTAPVFPQPQDPQAESFFKGLREGFSEIKVPVIRRKKGAKVEHTVTMRVGRVIGSMLSDAKALFLKTVLYKAGVVMENTYYGDENPGDVVIVVKNGKEAERLNTLFSLYNTVGRVTVLRPWQARLMKGAVRTSEGLVVLYDAEGLSDEHVAGLLDSFADLDLRNKKVQTMVFTTGVYEYDSKYMKAIAEQSDTYTIEALEEDELANQRILLHEAVSDANEIIVPSGFDEFEIVSKDKAIDKLLDYPIPDNAEVDNFKDGIKNIDRIKALSFAESADVIITDSPARIKAINDEARREMGYEGGVYVGEPVIIEGADDSIGRLIAIRDGAEVFDKSGEGLMLAELPSVEVGGMVFYKAEVVINKSGNISKEVVYLHTGEPLGDNLPEELGGVKVMRFAYAATSYQALASNIRNGIVDVDGIRSVNSYKRAVLAPAGVLSFISPAGKTKPGKVNRIKEC